MIRPDRTWVEISSSAVRHNLRQVQQLVGEDVTTMPIIKANAYGHGLREMLTILSSQSVTVLGVAYGEEAMHVRHLGWRGRIVVLSHWTKKELHQLVKNNVELVVWDEASYLTVGNLARRTTSKPKVHLKLDTGTTRIGFLPSDRVLIKKIIRDPRLRVIGIFSHFANAEERSPIRTRRQLIRFATLVDIVLPKPTNRGIERHIACTAAILRYPEARFGLIRLGIGLYGLWPSTEIQAWSRGHLRQVRLRPVLSWYTYLAQVKTIPRGTAIGYGSTVIAKRRLRLGVLPVGYADGYDRRLSNRGYVMIDGHPAPIVGRICMNLSMVDLSNVPKAKSGTKVTLIGFGITADTLADYMNDIHYEVTTRINWSLPRYIVT